MFAIPLVQEHYVWGKGYTLNVELKTHVVNLSLTVSTNFLFDFSL